MTNIGFLGSFYRILFTIIPYLFSIIIEIYILIKIKKYYKQSSSENLIYQN